MTRPKNTTEPRIDYSHDRARTTPSHRPAPPRYTRHAAERAIERCIPPLPVSAALRWGRCIRRRAGVDLLLLDAAATAMAHAHGWDVGTYIGLEVAVKHDGLVVTFYMRGVDR